MDGDIIHNSEKKNIFEHDRCETYLMQPTIAEVVMWLYEKYNIWVKVDCASKDFWYPSIINIENGNFKVHPSYVSENFIKQNNRMFNSPTEAYEEGIKYTLNNLI